MNNKNNTKVSINSALEACQEKLQAEVSSNVLLSGRVKDLVKENTDLKEKLSKYEKQDNQNPDVPKDATPEG